jgi:UDP-N-acetyl-D-mannosaminuronate dehydrogenase
MLGFDVSPDHVESLRKTYEKVESRVTFTLAPEDLSKATHFLISVPTPILEDKSINTSYVQSALATIAKHARRGSTIVVESSVAVGMTRQLVGPLAKERGFFAGMSPEVGSYGTDSIASKSLY